MYAMSPNYNNTTIDKSVRNVKTPALLVQSKPQQTPRSIILMMIGIVASIVRHLG